MRRDPWSASEKLWLRCQLATCSSTMFTMVLQWPSKTWRLKLRKLLNWANISVEGQKHRCGRCGRCGKRLQSIAWRINFGADLADTNGSQRVKRFKRLGQPSQRHLTKHRPRNRAPKHTAMGASLFISLECCLGALSSLSESILFLPFAPFVSFVTLCFFLFLSNFPL